MWEDSPYFWHKDGQNSKRDLESKHRQTKRKNSYGLVWLYLFLWNEQVRFEKFLARIFTFIICIKINYNRVPIERNTLLIK